MTVRPRYGPVFLAHVLGTGGWHLELTVTHIHAAPLLRGINLALPSIYFRKFMRYP